MASKSDEDMYMDTSPVKEMFNALSMGLAIRPILMGSFSISM